MRLRHRIGAAMAAVTLAGIVVTGLLTSLGIRRTIAEESEKELTAASQALLGEWRSLGSDIGAQLTQVSQQRAFRSALSRLARRQVPAESDEIIGAARRVLADSGLDFLQVIDERGRVLSNGHWPVFYGRVDSTAWNIVTRQGTGAVVHWRNVQGRRLPAVESSMPFEVADVSYHLVGGRALTPGVVDDLGRRTGGALYIHLADGTRIVPDGVIVQDVTHLVDAERVESGPVTYVVGRPPTGEAAKVSLLPIKGPEGTVVGDFVLRISQLRLVNLERELTAAFLGVAAIGLVLAWGIGFWFARRITRPVEELAAAARRVGVGRSPGRMPEESNDEVGDLVRSFRRMTLDLAESRSELVRAERLAAWRDIAQRMAHEIKNALSPIQISVETIQRSQKAGRADLGDIVDESVTTVRDEVRTLRNLVNEFSQFARMPDLRTDLQPLNAIVERAASLHARNERGVPVETTLAPDLPEAQLDAEALGRAVGNIILNAVEASPPGSAVHVTTGRSGDDGLEILVDDRGPGVPADEREKIFEPYYTTKPSGTGLGLAMAWKIVTEHGGRIDILDAAEGGARFRIVLPIVPPAG
jgi:two-component system nitrogen regulation sensor histidine kinase NtrY